MGSSVTLPNLSTSGTSGNAIDVVGLVAQAMYAERAPERLMQAQQDQFNAQASALQDLISKLQALQNSVNALQDPLGAFSGQVATSSNTAVLTATAGTGATSATHTVVVSALATTSSYYSNTLSSSSTTFNTGSFTLQVGTGTPVPINVDTTNNTLDKLAAYINSQSYGVTASVITDSTGARLSLVSNTSGAPGDLSITSNTTGLTFTKGVTGTNASLTVDGVPISSASNTVTGVIPGVTLNLTGTSASQVSVTVSPDTTKARSAIDNFVSSYNAVIQAINAQFAYNSTTKTAGVLAGDGALRIVEQNLLNDANFSMSGSGAFPTLQSIGVNVQQDGTLSEDNTALGAALTSNFAQVQSLLQGSSGVGAQFKTDLTNLANPTNGPLQLDLNGVQSSLTALTNSINDFEARMVLKQQQLTDEFSQINAILQQMPLLIQQINSQLGLGQASIAY